MKQETILPKNIRQIGEIQSEKRVYLEDYVMTFIRKREHEAEDGGCAGILLGAKEKTEEGEWIFIRGAVHQDDEMEQMRSDYFPDQEVVGCYVIGKMKEEDLAQILDDSARPPFVIYHMQEGEERVYWSEEQQCQRMDGYFIFYERNPQMQKYMADCCEPKKVEEEEGGSDRAIISFREKIKEKSTLVKPTGMRYLAGSFLTLVILLLGVTIINNYDRMKNMEEVISQISVEQERERLRIAAEYAAREADSAAVKAEDVQEQQTEAVSEMAEAIFSLPEETERQTEAEEEASAASSNDILAELDIETSQAVRGLAERNYSAEDADLVDSDLWQEAAKIAQPSARQTQSAYTIKYGDTLADISQRYYGSLDKVEEICALNNIDDANLIVPGQKIVLP